jgi:DNA repair protein RecN (Recombination protein N)
MGGDGEGAAPALAAAAQALEGVAGVDAELDALAARARALALEAEDLVHELRRYAEGVEAPPGRLDEVEERLALLERLKRKHGGTVEAVLAYAATCRRRRDELAGAEEAIETAERDLEQARAELTALAARLTAARTRAGAELAEAVRARLQALAMEAAEFAAAVNPRDGLGPTGADEVEFLIAPNPGVPAGPLREIASGGELSRVMLALMGVAAEAGPPTLVFDEVDAGIGGRAAAAVGERLARLAEHRQVLVVTHLAQIAAHADRHFVVTKETGATTVRAVQDDDRTNELARMLSGRVSQASVTHARELLVTRPEVAARGAARR